MNWFWILVIPAAVLICAAALISYICYRMAFLAVPEPPLGPEEFSIPKGEIYEPFRETMVEWMRQVRAMPCEELWVRSFDGLKLHGRYYEYAPGAPIELMFHGYRGTSERDLCGGVQRCFSLGHSALIVDQRGSGESEGRTITFGVNESRDCQSWLARIQERFGPDVRVILCGISMGAATVLTAAGGELPDNVIGVLADCGYTSARAIIKKVIRQLGLPAGPAYPFVKLGARLYGRFDLEEVSPIEAMKHCKVPVIFFHGEADDFVPCDMSRENHAACAAEKKRLVTVPGAGHGLCYLMAPEDYLAALREFFP